MSLQGLLQHRLQFFGKFRRSAGRDVPRRSWVISEPQVSTAECGCSRLEVTLLTPPAGRVGGTMVGSVGHSTSRAALRDGGTNDGPSAGPMACKGRVAKRRTRQRGDGRQRSYGGRVSTRAPVMPLRRICPNHRRLLDVKSKSTLRPGRSS